MITDVELGRVERIILFSLAKAKSKRRHDNMFKICKDLS